MTTSTTTTWISADGNARDVFVLLSRHPLLHGLPVRILNGSEALEPAANWLEVAVREGGTKSVVVSWAGPRGPYGGSRLSWFSHGVIEFCLRDRFGLDDAVRVATDADAEIVVVGQVFEDWTDVWRTCTFSNAHTTHGLGVIFHGSGHDRVVSRRWLEHGPWLVGRQPNDVTSIQFYASDADSKLAWDQCFRAHERMGFSDSGGYIHPEHQQWTKSGGLYKAADRSLTIVRAATPITQLELLDLCALRAHRKKYAQPVERIRVLFTYERDARRHLHELWLREIECWHFDPEGHEVRLDDTYQPERITPEWVERAEGREPRRAPVELQLSLGLASVLSNPQDPGGDWCRDDLLMHLLDYIGYESIPADYEVREVLDASIPRVSALEGEHGALVVQIAPGIMGTMREVDAAPLLAKVQAVEPSVDLRFPAERLGLTLPAIIVPDPYPEQRPFQLGDDHPLNGVIVHQVSDVLARVRSLNREDLRAAEALLRLCAEDRFVLSARRP
ncbi:MAG: hypothetical protein WKG01_05935 [Kofleriaceae bacterium]